MGAITIHSKKGQRILDFLMKELDLPKTTIEFDLHISPIDCIVVKNLSYYVVDDKEIEVIEKTYVADDEDNKIVGKINE